MTTSHCRFFQRVELAVAIADQLLDFVRQFARMRFAAIERRHLVSAAERVTNLIRPGESGPAENENAQRLHGFSANKGPTLSAVPAAAESLMNWRRVVDVFMFALHFFCHSEHCQSTEESLAVIRINVERCFHSARHDKSANDQQRNLYAT